MLLGLLQVQRWITPLQISRVENFQNKLHNALNDIQERQYWKVWNDASAGQHRMLNIEENSRKENKSRSVEERIYGNYTRRHKYGPMCQNYASYRRTGHIGNHLSYFIWFPGYKCRSLETKFSTSLPKPSLRKFVERSDWSLCDYWLLSRRQEYVTGCQNN